MLHNGSAGDFGSSRGGSIPSIAVNTLVESVIISSESPITIIRRGVQSFLFLGYGNSPILTVPSYVKIVSEQKFEVSETLWYENGEIISLI